MKKFIVNFGTILIDIFAWVILVALLISSIVYIFTEPFAGLLFLAVGLIAFVSIFYILYLFIDTNETLHKILEKMPNEKND